MEVFKVTTEMLNPLGTAIAANITAMFPTCMTIFGGILSAKMVPSFIYKFI